MERLMPQRKPGAASKVERTRVTDRQLQLATAVLLLEVARCDFDLRADELNAVSRGVREVLGLTEDEAVAVVRFAEEEVRQSKRLYQFTDLIDKNYSPDQKKLVVQYLWQVAFADAQLVATEEYIVRKIADLLHVSLADFLDAKINARDSFRNLISLALRLDSRDTSWQRRVSMFLANKKLELPTQDEALPGRTETMEVPDAHFVNGNPLTPPFPEGMQRALFGLGCFWGAEKAFWDLDGVFTTAVGYAGGITPNPTYQEVCTGRTGHNEVVLVVFDPKVISYEELLKTFWESHDPTQGMRQGGDTGTQYRSGIYTYGPDQAKAAEASLERYQEKLREADYDPITTEIVDASEFYYAEEYHQQYLEKNPGGYCGLVGTGVACPMSLAVE